MYNAKIIADSLNTQGDRITTFIVTYPRIIHAEMCKHRMHSRNTASSRAIPFEKMVKDVEENPFIPLAWQKSHKGMQGTEYVKDMHHIATARANWKLSYEYAIKLASNLNSNIGITKQLCNRLLEPFVWTTELITATEWENFFDLRCPDYRTHNEGARFKSKKDYLKYFPESKEMQNDNLFWLNINKSPADIHIQAIAEFMYDAYNESIPKQLQAGEWHIPNFGHKWDDIKVYKLSNYKLGDDLSVINSAIEQTKIKISTAHNARISYKTLGGNPKIDYRADIKLHDRLLNENHMSPFEHACRAMSDEEYEKNNWCRNFKGFISYRHIVENGD
jgi:thymidylate synthase ThyX